MSTIAKRKKLEKRGETEEKMSRKREHQMSFSLTVL